MDRSGTYLFHLWDICLMTINEQHESVFGLNTKSGNTYERILGKLYVAGLPNDIHCTFPPGALMNTVSSYEAAYCMEWISYNFLIWTLLMLLQWDVSTIKVNCAIGFYLVNQSTSWCKYICFNEWWKLVLIINRHNISIEWTKCLILCCSHANCQENTKCMIQRQMC